MAEPARTGGSWTEGMSSDNIKGLVLALSSSFFIGSSFIVKKKGLKKAGASGVRAGVGGYSYLYEPLWWIGMITMILGEIANFAAYAFAPAILVTPLGALSIIISAALAHIILRERLHIFGVLGCVLCVVGSTTIVLHAPQEREIESVAEVWHLATEPGFLLYAAVVIAAVFVLIIHVIPQYGQTHIMVYIGVCSLVGSLSVMSVKALGIALNLTFSGINQLIYPQTWVFTIVVLTCVITQINYLNKLMILVDEAGGFFPSINHSPWNDVTLADFVMPFFLFIVGVALALADKNVPDRVDATRKAVLRALKLFIVGLILRGGYFHGVQTLTYGVDILNIRFMGALQLAANFDSLFSGSTMSNLA